MKSLNIKLRKLPAWKLIPFATAVAILFSIFFHGTIELLGIPDIIFSPGPSVKNDGLVMMIFGGVIIAPLFETLISQLVPYWLLSKVRYFRKHRLWIIVISGVFFGLMHTYSLHYIIYTSIVGMYLMYLYIIRRWKSEFWIVAGVHALFNAIVAVVELLVANSILK